jgi:putative transposase
VSPRKRDNESGRQLSTEEAAAAAMVAEAKARGLELTGPNGLSSCGHTVTRSP